MSAWLQDRIGLQLATRGDALAIDAGKAGQLSYAALADRVASLSARLDAGDACGNVGILSNHRIETYVAVLALFLSGRTFVPLNPGFPEARLAAIHAQAGGGLVLCDAATQALSARLGMAAINVSDVSDMEDAEAGRTLCATVSPGDAIAYRMFTSGSTGNPKGVPIPLSSLEHYVAALDAMLGLEPGLRFSQCFDLSFDLAMHDIFLALSTGGTLVPPGGMDLLMPHSYVAKKALDIWFSVPMLAAPVMNARLDESHRQLRHALFCGEQLPTRFAREFGKLVKPGGMVLNLYGPTEATIAFTARDVATYHGEAEIAPIGAPFGENRIALLLADETIAEVAEGVEGELLLGGPQVFGGYEPAVDRPVFVHAGDGSRFYRSGDLVRMADDELHHLGRLDDQVKVRGFRIELGDIEAAFRRVFDRPQAAATVVGEQERAVVALAYCGARIDYDPARLAEVLPDYMVPRYVRHIDVLPVNANGKVDRKALKAGPWA